MVLFGSKVILMTGAGPSAEKESLRRLRGGELEEGRSCAFKEHKGFSEHRGWVAHQMVSASDGQVLLLSPVSCSCLCNKRQFCLFWPYVCPSSCLFQAFTLL